MHVFFEAPYTPPIPTGVRTNSPLELLGLNTTDQASGKVISSPL